MPKLKPDHPARPRASILDAAEQCFAPRRLPPHHHARHLQGGRRQPRRALRLLRQQGGADRRHLRARPRRVCRASRQRSPPRPTSPGADGSWASSISRGSPRYKQQMCLEIGLESTRNPRVGEIFQRQSTRYIARSFREAVPAHARRGPHRPALDIPTAGEAVHGHRRRHVLAPRRRSRLRSGGRCMPAVLQLIACAAQSRGRRRPHPQQQLRARRVRDRSCEKITDRRACSRVCFADDLAHAGRQAAAAGDRPGGCRARQADACATVAARRGRDGRPRRAGRFRARPVLATGSLVAREEILVGPEVEGLRVTEVLADEGTRGEEGRRAGPARRRHARCAGRPERCRRMARATAAIAQARSVPSCRPRRASSKPATRSSGPGRLRRPGTMAEGAVRPARAGRHARPQAQLARRRATASRSAEAEKAQIEAQRRELTWRRGRTEVMAPADGIVSRRMARVGGYAAGAAEPMFRIVAKAARSSSTPRSPRRAWPPSRSASPRASRLRASARLPAPCGSVSPGGRQGDALWAACASILGDNPGLRVGAFARGTIATGATAAGSPCQPPPSSTAPDGPTGAGGARQPRRDAPGSRPGWRPARWPRCARVSPRANSSSRAPAPSCAMAMRCGRCQARPRSSEARR